MIISAHTRDTIALQFALIAELSFFLFKAQWHWCSNRAAFCLNLMTLARFVKQALQSAPMRSRGNDELQLFRNDEAKGRRPEHELGQQANHIQPVPGLSCSGYAPNLSVVVTG